MKLFEKIYDEGWHLPQMNEFTSWQETWDIHLSL